MSVGLTDAHRKGLAYCWLSLSWGSVYGRRELAHRDVRTAGQRWPVVGCRGNALVEHSGGTGSQCHKRDVQVESILRLF